MSTPTPTTPAPANTTTIVGTVTAGGKNLVGSVVHLDWLSGTAGQFTADTSKVEYPITAAKGYTFAVPAGTFQLHAVVPPGYFIVGDNPRTVTVSAGLPATVNFTAVLGSTSPVATPTSQPVVVPPVVAPVPVTPVPAGPMFTLGVTDDVTSAIFVTSPAPATVHASSLNQCATPGEWMTCSETWDFGDPGRELVTDPRTGNKVDVSSGQRYATVAYQYTVPGTYTVTHTRTTAAGVTTIDRRMVLVPIPARTTLYVSPTGNDANPGTDPAHPLKTPAGATAKLKAAVAVLFERGQTFTFNVDMPLKHDDILVDCYGDPTLPVPVFSRANPDPKVTADDAPTFTTWPGQTSNVTLRNFTLDSPYNLVGTGATAYRAGVSNLATFRGQNVTVADVGLRTTSYGAASDGSLAGGFYLRLAQLDPAGISSRVLWMQGAKVVAIGVVGLASPTESPIRMADGGCAGWAVAYSTMAQPAGQPGKAGGTLRTGQDGAVYGSLVANAQLTLDPRTAAATMTRTVVDGNLFANGSFATKANVQSARITNNHFTGLAGPAITVNASDGVTEFSKAILVSGNTGTGSAANARMVQMGTPGPGLVDALDDGTNVLTRVAG